VFNEIGFPDDREEVWIELYHLGRRRLSLENWTLALGEDRSYRLPAAHLPPKGFAVLCADTLSFRRAHPACTAVLVQLPGLWLHPTKQTLELLDAAGGAVDSTGYLLAPEETASFLALRRPDTDNGVPANWQHDQGPGTPGAHHPEAVLWLQERKAQQRWVSAGALVAICLLIWAVRRFLAETDHPVDV
jgi:hypothetical protein